MASPINEKELEHLASLARIELKESEKTKLLHDLEKILGHFDELKTLETAHVDVLKNPRRMSDDLRDDESRENTNQGAGKEQFPETHEGYLKIPPVFGE
ncbi:MAG: Asp-tRNA(Asn)/Glu-tRNA(Gln) amidotransferase subunit GatC [bacterium]|nr:Asp-tRNA(Asn)/Glu-tRNA(Gln) amidotransferase subunit GatC [bacterium]